MKKIIQKCSGGHSDLIEMSKNSVLAEKVPLLSNLVADFSGIFRNFNLWFLTLSVTLSQWIMTMDYNKPDRL